MLRLRLIAILLSVGSLSFGEKGVLNIFLSDFQNRPLGRRSGVHIGVKAPALSGYPDDNGTLLLPIGPDINPGDTVQLILLEPETLFMVSPWDSRAVVPKSSDYASVVLAPKGSVEALKQARVREAIAAQINSNRAPRTVADNGSAGASGDVTSEAKATGYTPEQLRDALQVWAKGVQSPRSKAIAALWAGDYNAAVRQSKAALEARPSNDKASADQTLFEMSLFLAQALYEKGDYEQAAAAAQIAASVRPDDERALNVLGVYLAKAGKPDTALAYLRGAASLEKQLSSSSLATFNVAEELLHKGEVGAAKQLYEQVIEDQKACIRRIRIYLRGPRSGSAQSISRITALRIQRKTGRATAG